jgi:type VI protein secretion system component VasK
MLHISSSMRAQDIIERMKIQPLALKDDKPIEVARMSIPPKFETPESLVQLNAILSFHSLPNFSCSDSVGDKIRKLMEINKKSKIFDNRSMCSTDIVSDTPTKNIQEMNGLDSAANIVDALAKKIDSINKHKEIEADCDVKEVNLANMKVNTLAKYKAKSIEDLQAQLQELKDNFNSLHALDSSKDLLNEICAHKKNKKYDSICQNLQYLRDKTKGAYMKEKVKKMLASRSDNMSKVLHKIVEEGISKVENIGNKLQIESLELLKIVYNLCSKGITEYDRTTDTVFLKK